MFFYIYKSLTLIKQSDCYVIVLFFNDNNKSTDKNHFNINCNKIYNLFFSFKKQVEKVTALKKLKYFKMI